MGVRTGGGADADEIGFVEKTDEAVVAQQKVAATNGRAQKIEGEGKLKNTSVARSAAVNDGERHRAAAGRPRGSESGLMNFKILVVVASLLASVAAAPSFRLSEVGSPADGGRNDRELHVGSLDVMSCAMHGKKKSCKRHRGAPPPPSPPLLATLTLPHRPTAAAGAGCQWKRKTKTCQVKCKKHKTADACEVRALHLLKAEARI